MTVDVGRTLADIDTDFKREAVKWKAAAEQERALLQRSASIGADRLVIHYWYAAQRSRDLIATWHADAQQIGAVEMRQYAATQRGNAGYDVLAEMTALDGVLADLQSAAVIVLAADGDGWVTRQYIRLTDQATVPPIGQVLAAEFPPLIAALTAVFDQIGR